MSRFYREILGCDRPSVGNVVGHAGSRHDRCEKLADGLDQLARLIGRGIADFERALGSQLGDLTLAR